VADDLTPQDAPRPQDCVEHEWDEIWAMGASEPAVIICSRCGWRRGKLVATWRTS
jgi:hypothetical protein